MPETIRAYYRVDLTRNTMASRRTDAVVQGATESIFAHEWPQYSVSADETYGVLRVHWNEADEPGGQDTYEGKNHVSPLTIEEARVLVAGWLTPDEGHDVAEG